MKFSEIKENSPLWFFTVSYIGTCLGSATDDNGGNLDDGRDRSDIAPESLDSMAADCLKFYNENESLIHCDDAPLARDCPDSSIKCRESAMAGHDFSLTRNNHGAGFWDGDWPEPSDSILTKASEEFGETLLYIGDDGLIHVQ